MISGWGLSRTAWDGWEKTMKTACFLCRSGWDRWDKITPGWIVCMDTSVKMDNLLGLPRLICLEYKCVEKEFDNKFCIGIHLDFYHELSREENIMIIVDCKSYLCWSREHGFLLWAPAPMSKLSISMMFITRNHIG